MWLFELIDCVLLTFTLVLAGPRPCLWFDHTGVSSFCVCISLDLSCIDNGPNSCTDAFGDNAHADAESYNVRGNAKANAKAARASG